MRLLFVALSAALILPAPSPGFIPASAQNPDPAPVSWVCSMPSDVEVVQDAPGRCPLCSMPLVPVRIRQKWSCPVHTFLKQDASGICRVDRQRALKPIVVSESWKCDAEKTQFADPGTCANGQPRTFDDPIRAHGDHNPRHGGEFAMAPDRWHHLEATYPREGLFRLYVYDNYTKPLSAKGMTGRVVTKEEPIPLTNRTNELESFPLRVAGDGTMLEAQIGARVFRLDVRVRLSFDPRLPEASFNFSFHDYSREPAPPSH